MLIIAFISFRAFKNKQHANKEISQQKHIIEEKQKAITQQTLLKFLSVNSSIKKKQIKDHSIILIINQIINLKVQIMNLKVKITRIQNIN